MTLYEYLNFATRIITVGSALYVTAVLLASLIRTRDINGLGGTRWAILVLSVGLFVSYGIRLYGDVNAFLGLATSLQRWLANVSGLLLLGNIAVAAGALAFALLFWYNKKHE